MLRPPSPSHTGAKVRRGDLLFAPSAARRRPLSAACDPPRLVAPASASLHHLIREDHILRIELLRVGELAAGLVAVGRAQFHLTGLWLVRGLITWPHRIETGVAPCGQAKRERS